MSAEACVTKCFASLNAGESHCWEPYEVKLGLEPVMISKNFLRDSIEKTVKLYESVQLKEQVAIAILGPGTMAIPYLCHYFKAIYLPTQFLVSFNRLEDVQQLLEAAEKQELASYAVVGVDRSMVKVAVAWLKLLTLPPQYKKILTDWKIQQVLYVDNDQTDQGLRHFRHQGENCFRRLCPAGASPFKLADLKTERRVLGDYGAVAAREIYFLYAFYGNTASQAGFEEDEKEFKARISEHGTGPHVLDESIKTGDDWESSMTRQIPFIQAAIRKAFPEMPVHKLQAKVLVHLYHLPFHLALHKAKKEDFKGIAMNPYYICNPLFEEVAGYVPFCFWQGNPSVPDYLHHHIKLAETNHPGIQARLTELWIKSIPGGMAKNWNDHKKKGLETQLKHNGINIHLVDLFQADENPILLNAFGWARWYSRNCVLLAVKPEELLPRTKARQALTIEDLKKVVADMRMLGELDVVSMA